MRSHHAQLARTVLRPQWQGSLVTLDYLCMCFACSFSFWGSDSPCSLLTCDLDSTGPKVCAPSRIPFWRQSASRSDTPRQHVFRSAAPDSKHTTTDRFRAMVSGCSPTQVTSNRLLILANNKHLFSFRKTPLLSRKRALTVPESGERRPSSAGRADECERRWNGNIAIHSRRSVPELVPPVDVLSRAYCSPRAYPPFIPFSVALLTNHSRTHHTTRISGNVFSFDRFPAGTPNLRSTQHGRTSRTRRRTCQPAPRDSQRGRRRAHHL